MGFKESYELFLGEHLKKRTGERSRRLREGHGHAEKQFLEHVWWPAFKQFDHLHPEYEIHDFKDGHRYLDFAFLRPPLRVCLEIDGFGPHWRDINRWQFADYLLRQNHLVIDGWTVFRFSYDEIMEKPRRCQQLLQQFVGRWLGVPETIMNLGCYERDIVRLAMKHHRPLKASDVSRYLNIGGKYARKLLRQLSEKGLFVPSGGDQRISCYRLTMDQMEHLTHL
jgi:very-short-patch-repair endonuclease